MLHTCQGCGEAWSLGAMNENPIDFEIEAPYLTVKRCPECIGVDDITDDLPGVPHETTRPALAVKLLVMSDNQYLVWNLGRFDPDRLRGPHADARRLANGRVDGPYHNVQEATAAHHVGTTDALDLSAA